MGKASKATKKFQKNHLKRTVDQRKTEQKYKQQFLQQKKKGKKEYVGEDDTPENVHNENEVFENGSAESFFNSNTDNLALGKPKKSKSSANALNDTSAENNQEFLNYLNDEAPLDIEPSTFDKEEEEDYEEEEVFGEITKEMIKAWKKSLEKEKSLKSLKRALSGFRAFSASNSNDLILLALNTLPSAIHHHIPPGKGTSKTQISIDNKKFKALTPALKTFASALSTQLRDSDEEEVITAIYKILHTFLPYFLPLRKQIKVSIEAVVQLSFSQNSKLCQESFGFLKSAVEEHSSILDLILKSSHNAILKSSQKPTIETMDKLNSQMDSAVALFTINPTVSFELGFQYVRQLALHLRSSITNKSPEAYKTIYNWQFVNSLDFWSRVVSAQCEVNKEALSGKASPMRELIYPLVQVTLGTIRLIPTPQYFPLRFYLLRSLLRLAQAASVYIPLLPLITEVLSASFISKVPKLNDLPALDFEHTIRASKAYLGTKVYQDGVCDEFIDLTGEFFFQHSCSIAFPELTAPAIILFEKFSKRSKNTRFNTQLLRLAEKLEQNSKFIQQKRNSINFSPAHKAEAAVFLKGHAKEKTPLGSFVLSQRQSRAEKVRLLRKQLQNEQDKESSDNEDLDEEMSDY